MTTYLGIDVGTSSVKAVLIDGNQNVIAEASSPVEVLRPRPMWSEQNPEGWWIAAQEAVAHVREVAPQDFLELEAIGLSGQQHSATLLDRHGCVLRPAILWNDGRCGRECAELLERVPDFLTRAFNTTMPGFTAPKLLWVARHEPEIFKETAKVLLPKDYLRFRLSGAFVSDMSDSAGTLWLNIARRTWDEVLLEGGGMTLSQMPDLVEGSEISTYLSRDVASMWGLGDRRVPIAGGGGDNASSAVGIGAVGMGDGFLSLGTSGVLFVSTDRLVSLPERTLHGFCHALPQRWHGMVVALSAASALSWLGALLGQGHDIAGLIRGAETFAADPERRRSAPIFLPYLTGERTPHNDPNATARFDGLRAEHDSAALAYAVLEGVAFALADGLDVLKAADAAPSSCMLVGGGSRSAFWNGLLADVLAISLDLPEGAEIGAAFGAARLGMVAAGAGTIDDVCKKPAIRARFNPDPEKLPLLAIRRNHYLKMYPS
ncbi:MAG: xylulokinase [Phyllobacterium sp.]|uniref:xylulokinase n=1 Tax=Phyllobacterium sp. TaxID=1871046 RepID=UPI0030F10E72